jgi:hypothetical protein
MPKRLLTNVITLHPCPSQGLSLRIVVASALLLAGIVGWRLTHPLKDETPQPLAVPPNVKIVRRSLIDGSDRGEIVVTTLPAKTDVTTFHAETDECVTVEFHMTEPAYGYVVVLTPNGKLLPYSRKQTGASTRGATLPLLPESQRGDGFGLHDVGRGVITFALVVSRSPLEPFAKQLEGRKDFPSFGASNTNGVVWFDDGKQIRTFQKGKTAVVERGPDQPILGLNGLANFSDWLKHAAGGEAVGAVAFEVK